MRVIRAQNVNHAYVAGLDMLLREGESLNSRAGPVRVMREPVSTVYERPTQRVLLDPGRDANPFFHLFESLWMLAGRRDARWLDRFVRDFSQRFAEDDGQQHGAYGYRWRRHFDLEGGGRPGLPDQLDTVVQLLRANPDDRRVVLTMWDPVADLGTEKRDIPCNTHAYLRLRIPSWSEAKVLWEERGAKESERDAIYDRHVLDLTVCCRSNDAVWGAYGANAVHFSVLQEYIAGRLGVGVGRYTQVSNNFHGYVSALEKVGVPSLPGAYPGTVPMGQDWSCWDADLSRFMAWTENEEPDQQPQNYPSNPWFQETAEPLFVAHGVWKQGDREHALALVSDRAVWPGMAPDWRLAAQQWFERRMK